MAGTLTEADPGALRWRPALATWIAGVAWTLAWFHGTVVSMIQIWLSSETFTHAFLVLPISLWLVWRNRATVASLPIRPTARPLIFAVAAGAAWLLGDLATVNALTQLSLVAILVSLTVAMFGTAIGAAIAFPLGFLFFMVPIGEFALPQLMDWTATVTVLALRLSGIPVFQEGLQFVIPSGRWSVVEACSGIRYLIASLCVGTLFAYLNYTSLKRRLLFVAVSLVVPIVANWIRAYLIVMIGHLSSGALAVGVDHLIYGWLFFGLVIAIMFAIGARWSEAPQSSAPIAGLPSRGSPSALIDTRVLILAALAVALAPGLRAILDQTGPSGAVTLAAIESLPGWQEEASPARWEPAFAGADAARFQSFRRGGETVGVHLRHYRNQDSQRKLVSSTNAIVRSDDRNWSLIGSGSRELTLAGQAVRVRTSTLRGRDGSTLLVWHWYWLDGYQTASDIGARLRLAWNRLNGVGDDASGVFLFAQADGGEAEATLTAFASQLQQPLQAALRRATAEDRP